jgi:hypothetical protein
MTVQQIRAIARQMGIQKYWKFRRPDLIRAVQIAEGNHACFGQNTECAQEECLWWTACLEWRHTE